MIILQIKVIGWLLLLLITYYVLDTNGGDSNASYYNQWIQWCRSESDCHFLPDVDYGKITPPCQLILLTCKQLLHALTGQQWSDCITIVSQLYTPIIDIIHSIHEIVIMVIMNSMCILYKYIQIHYRITS